MEILPPRIRVLFSTRSSIMCLLMITLILALIISPTTSIPDYSEIPYSLYCNGVVHEPPFAGSRLPAPGYKFLRLRHATFNATTARDSRQFSLNAVTFRPHAVYQTDSPNVLKVSGVVRFVGPGTEGLFGNVNHRRLLRMVIHPRRDPIRGYRYPASFRVYGYWDSGSGDLCMVGSGVSPLTTKNVVLKLNYRNSSTILTSLVNGTLQSLEQVGSVNYFNPVSILGISDMGYNYSLIDQEVRNGGFSAYDGMENVSLNLTSNRGLCPWVGSAGIFHLVYGNDCDALSCNFLNRSGEGMPLYMKLSDVECLADGKGRYLLGFFNSSVVANPLPFDPYTTLVAEGAWDVHKKRLDLVACQVVSDKFSLNMGSIGGCSIRMALSVPLILTLRKRSGVIGEIWSNRSINGSSNLGTVKFRSPENMNSRLGGQKYEYTEIENVSKVCQKRLNGDGKKAMYPAGNSSNLRFSMIVKNSKGEIASGFTSPLSVADQFYVFSSMYTYGRGVGLPNQVHQGIGGKMNVSYALRFSKIVEFRLGGEDAAFKSVEISAEGVYNSETGIACLIGCRHPSSQKLQTNETQDCGILVNFQYSPLNGKDEGHVKGTIESTRNKNDPLYFDPLELSSNSITTFQARESIWRMDLEITMVLISNTLACIFVGLQLFYVKKNPNVLPFISVMMLIVLTLAHMIPLLLNFEAMFLANRKQNVFLGSDGWLEVNEVLVRIITMIAFLLQFRLLQLSWSARNGNESQKSLWVSDKKVLYFSLPLYIAGGLIAWFAHSWGSYQKTHPTSSLFTPRPGYPQQVRFWGELKSYAGLVLDGFLLPQIVFNLFCDSTEKALAPSFYVGSTMVRLLPHLYDLYRMHSSPWLFNKIYANPRMDYYSTAWDVSISCCGLLFVFLVFLQQRFGGRFFLPNRFKRSNVYEKVPVVSS